jgi:hypothetical protein
MDETLKKRIQGEAYFLRGLHYFNIAEVYGRGPLKLTSFTENGKPVIAEQPELLNQALKDFETAIPLLPTNYTELTNIGRVTQGAARGMRIKVLMQQHQWQAAADECATLINLKNTSGQIMYSLVPKFVDNFTQANENNAESIFEIQFAPGLQNGLDVGCQRAKFMGIPVNGAAYADAFPRVSLYNEFLLEQTATKQPDPRLKVTLAYYDPANSTETFYGSTWDQWKLDHKMVYWKKYTNYDIQTTEDLFNGINFRLIRLADIYLLYAEALNELGRTPESYTYIDKVRNRAGMPNLENSTVFTGIGNDHDKMKAQIMHERSCEMAGESTRWFDLERWGMFDNAAGISWLKTRDEDFNNFVSGVNNRFPIPYREIALVPITQNPGY